MTRQCESDIPFSKLRRVSETETCHLVAKSSKLLGSLALASGSLLGVSDLAGGDALALVVGSALGLSSLLQAGDDVLVLPADLVAETADGAVLAAGLQAENAEGLGNDHLLLLVVRGGDTLKDLEALESGGTTGSLVGDHATDGLVEDAGGGAEVEGTWLVSVRPEVLRQ